MHRRREFSSQVKREAFERSGGYWDMTRFAFTAG
jgi:hypothetical protein